MGEDTVMVPVGTVQVGCVVTVAATIGASGNGLIGTAFTGDVHPVTTFFAVTL